MPRVSPSTVFPIAVALATACASLRPPVQFEPSETAQQPSALRIEASEGRPSGLVVVFSCECEPQPGQWLELLRAEGSARPTVFRTFELDADLAAALSADGLPFLDRSVEPGKTVTYRLRLRASRDGEPATIVQHSSPLSFEWQRPPPRPEQVLADSPVPGVVELRWKASAGERVLVFRRNVLQRQARPERIAQLGPGAGGLFVDRKVRPAGVYAYRVALAREAGPALQFGPPSQEIYVTVATSTMP